MTPKQKSRQKVVIQEETPVRRSPRMRGQILKDPILPKAPTTESPVQIISDHSPPHPEMTEIPDNLTTEGA